MNATQQNPIPANAVLAIIPNEEDRQSLRSIFGQSNWKLRVAATLSEARGALQHGPFAVIITDDTLEDGRSWRDILELADDFGRIPVIVGSRTAGDHLWAEVLNIGGFDVLSKPFNVKEVFMSVSMAWRSRRDAMRYAHAECVMAGAA